MLRLLLILVNTLLLVLFFMGLPEATRGQVAGWHIAWVITLPWLLIGGLLCGSLLNILVTLVLIKDRKQRGTGWEWATVFGLLALAQFALGQRWIHFDWLKTALQWAQKHL
jgi:hypothetical protein